MFVTIKTKIWNRSFFVFLLLATFSLGLLAVADEKETITAYFDDPDQDGLSTEEEKAYGTDPTNSDTDGDSYSDGVEVESGYDPLKPAPGDRVVVSDAAPSTTADAAATTTQDKEQNLTDLASQELSSVVSEKQDANAPVTNEDLNTAVSKVLETANEEVVLPEVSVDDIKVKEVSKKLDEEKQAEQKKQDAIEYLTTVSYIILSNAPTPIRSDGELQNFTMQAIQQLSIGVATGNYDVINTLESKSQKVLDEIKAVEVPESMLSTHVKATQIVKFLGSLGDRIKAIDPATDPVGQMMELARMQGAMVELQNFFSTAQSQMTDLGIKNIPLDI